jgi:hypothetical protein
MPTYPTITQFTEKQVLTAAELNELVDAIDIIRDPGRYYYARGSGDADLTTSSTSAADLNANTTVTGLDVSGNPVRVILYAGRHTTTATLTEIDLLVDGVSVRGGTSVWRGVTNVPVNFCWIVSGLSAGTHDFKIQWKINGAGTSTLFSAHGIWFEVREE